MTGQVWENKCLIIDKYRASKEYMAARQNHDKSKNKY